MTLGHMRANGVRSLDVVMVDMPPRSGAANSRIDVTQLSR
jgi:hypothetical protein